MSPEPGIPTVASMAREPLKVYRRIWHWFVWAPAPFFFADAIAEATVRGVNWESGKSLISMALCLVLGARFRQDLLLLSDSQISVRQPRETVSPVVELADLTAMIWENPHAICFGTRGGRPYVVSLGGLRRAQRREIREHLRSRVSAYREASTAKLGRAEAGALAPPAQ